jgi:hypothetical protein
MEKQGLEKVLRSWVAAGIANSTFRIPVDKDDLHGKTGA